MNKDYYKKMLYDILDGYKRLLDSEDYCKGKGSKQYVLDRINVLRQDLLDLKRDVESL